MSDIIRLDGSLSLYHGGSDGTPFLVIPDFRVKDPGVYTLEGPNGSGKSMFLGYLTGTLPNSIAQDYTTSLKIDGILRRISNYRDALECGIVSVFQRDDMITSMTVFDNIILQHGRSGVNQILNYIWGLVHANAIAPIGDYRSYIPWVSQNKLDEMYLSMKPNDTDWLNEKTLRERATKLLAKYDIRANILDQLPSRLSGGGKAASKLLCALMHSNARVLILDEAFSGVQRSLWPGFMDGVKQWAIDQNAAVIAVTHNAEELQRWNPNQRFCIVDGELTVIKTPNHRIRPKGAEYVRSTIPIFEFFGSKPDDVKSCISFYEWLAAERDILILVENGYEDHSILKMLELCKPGGTVVRRLSPLKDQYESVSNFLCYLEGVVFEFGCPIIIIGSSRFKSFAFSLVSITKHLGWGETVYVTTDFADSVSHALSHKVEVFTIDSSTAGERFSISCQSSPDSYLLSIESIQLLSDFQIKLAIAPCVRLGLLFDAHLYNNCKKIISSSTVDRDAVKEIFRYSIFVFNNIGEIGPDLPTIARVMSFGDAYAKMLMDLDSSIKNSGEALFLGMLLESLIIDSETATYELLHLVNNLGIGLSKELFSGDHASEELLLDKIFSFSKASIRSEEINALFIDEIAQFSVSEFRRKVLNLPRNYNRDVARYANIQARSSLRKIDMKDLRIGIARARSMYST